MRVLNILARQSVQSKCSSPELLAGCRQYQIDPTPMIRNSSKAVRGEGCFTGDWIVSGTSIGSGAIGDRGTSGAASIVHRAIRAPTAITDVEGADPRYRGQRPARRPRR